jgi:hypothetical protein
MEAVFFGALVALCGAHWSTGVGKAVLAAPAALLLAAWLGLQVANCVGGLITDNLLPAPNNPFGPLIAGVLPGWITFGVVFLSVEYCAVVWL